MLHTLYEHFTFILLHFFYIVHLFVYFFIFHSQNYGFYIHFFFCNVVGAAGIDTTHLFEFQSNRNMNKYFLLKLFDRRRKMRWKTWIWIFYKMFKSKTIYQHFFIINLIYIYVCLYSTSFSNLIRTHKNQN